ncbi:hypothetical protein GFY24_34200 [Nocardia sp. SYP-A9097]|nr:hypothetical protein [Nocardia sp. SYP-A9097]MRH92419.1 hypothetical protein [Nocardia sp. SYP-A9097]
MTETWSTDPAENAAITALSHVLQAMAAMLHSVENTHYTNPSGGFVLS